MLISILAVLHLLQLVSGRAITIPDELQRDAASWMLEDFSSFAKRADTCGGDSSLTQCGSDFPSDFCCGANSQCLLLNTTASVTAALCCPAGQDCQNIAAITCDQTLQNATSNPASPLHADPPMPLATCGSGCCPMGYSCQAGACKMQVVASSSASTATTVSLSSATASHLATSTIISSTNTAAVTEAPTAAPLEGGTGVSESCPFSGSSFAAGFVPGIFLGALVAAGLVFCTLRRENRKSGAYTNEKHYSTGRDTLTDLGPDVDRRPRVHGRSISEPTVDYSLGHRTEFLNSSPSNNGERGGPEGATGYVLHVQANGPTTPGEEQPSRTKGWLSRSPFMNYASSPVPTQSPVPTHLKRGTLSFQISPVRALRKQRSMHSLRRHMTNASSRSRRPDLSRTGSTETIQVLMDTPDTRPKMSNGSLPSAAKQPRSQTQAQAHVSQSATTWTTTSGSSSDNDSTPIETEPNTYTPTRPGRNSDMTDVGAALQSPYTPSNYPNTHNNHDPPNMLQIPGNDRSSMWRQTAATTFSGMMEKAGFRKSLLMGPDPRDWNK